MARNFNITLSEIKEQNRVTSLRLDIEHQCAEVEAMSKHNFVIEMKNGLETTNSSAGILLDFSSRNLYNRFLIAILQDRKI